MSGGTIADNTAKRGGGVCVRENGTFTMSGGTIPATAQQSIPIQFSCRMQAAAVSS